MTKSLRLLTLIILSGSCASKQAQDQTTKFKNEFKQEQLSLKTYLNLVKQSYVKGCITGMNLVEKKLTQGTRLDTCHDFSEKHIIGIKQILNTN